MTCWDSRCGCGPVFSSPPVFRWSPPGVSGASGRTAVLTKLGYDLILWSALYVGVLLILGILGRRAKREHTLSDHFLAGRSIGFVVLLLTLFATQYSGNSFSAFPGQTHRLGISYFMTVTFLVGVVTGYTLFAPRLFSLSRGGGYLTPTDYLDDRFKSTPLHYLSALIFAFTLVNFLLSQLMALGHAFDGITGGAIPYEVGVIGGGLVILCYELLGGMRAVAWTDVLQGTILGVGILLVVALIVTVVGTPGQILEAIRDVAPAKVENPGWRTCVVWINNFLMVVLGASLYPQAIQRIYAARSLTQLKKALTVMAFLPLVAVSSVVFIGLAGIVLFPDLKGVASDRVTFLVLAHLVENHELAYYPVLLVLLAIVAAIMSTADSCLLTFVSILTKDFAGRWRASGEVDGSQVMRLTPVFSICTMAILVFLALSPLTTLWGLIVIKFEVLIQLSPAFVLGTLHSWGEERAFSARDILAGLAVGGVLTLLLYRTDLRSLYGLQPGVIGLCANYLAVCLSRRLG